MTLERSVLEAIAHGRVREPLVGAVVESLLDGAFARPTDLDAVAAKVDVVGFESRPDLPYSGALKMTADGLMVLYAQGQRESRRRYTIAHELGHAYLYKLTSALDQREAAVEAFCDRFAFELVMPSALVRSSTAELALARVLELSSLFHTSLATAAMRLAEVTGAAVAVGDSDSVLWTAGSIRGLEPFVQRRIAAAIRLGERVVERVEDATDAWTFEAQPLAGTWQGIGLLQRA